MTEQPKDGGPAFPQLRSTGLVTVGIDGSAIIDKETDGGMSLRDWFAGRALAGDAANNENGCFSQRTTDAQLSTHAQLYYRIADAMLAARGAK